MNPPNNPQQHYWYKPIEERKPPLEPLTMLPMSEGESELSVDVLVYGYYRCGGGIEACYGIAYVDHRQVWWISTVNGSFNCNHDGTPTNSEDDFRLLMWRYLDDPPCDLPSVKNNAESADLSLHQQAAKSPDRVTSPYTIADYLVQYGTQGFTKPNPL